MLKKSLIIIPFHTKWNWSADYLKQTCLELVRNKNLVIAYMAKSERSFFRIFSELVRNHRAKPLFFKKHGVLFYYPILFIPFSRIVLIYSLNTFISIQILKLFIYLNKLYKERSVVWIFHPSFYLFPTYFGSRFLSLYDCVDYNSSLHPLLRCKIRKQESYLILHCDRMTVNSEVLYEKFKQMRSNISIVPQGFSQELFCHYKAAKRDKLTVHKGKKTIGFIGWLNFRLDFYLLLSLVKRCNDYNFVFVGSKQLENIGDIYTKANLLTERLLTYDNVYWIGSQPKRNIPGLIKQFDIAMIPYNTNLEFNTYCYPMKLFEYFYMGKPVVSTPIVELKRFPKYVKIGKNARDWEEIIKKLLVKPWPASYKKEQKVLATANSWENKLERISSIIEQVKKP